MRARDPLTEARPVCHVVYARFPADPRVRKEVETLAANGHRVDVVCLRQPGEAARAGDHMVRIFRLPLVALRGSAARYLYQYGLFFLLVFAWLTVNHLRHRYRVVHVHSLPDFLVFAALGCRLLGSALVLDLHESMPELYLARIGSREGSFMHGLTLAAQRLSCMIAHRVITVNSAIGEILAQRGIPESRVSIVENAPNWPTSPGPEASPLRDKMHNIVIVGGLNPERDLEVVLRAAAKLRRSANVRWRIIGYGDASYRRSLVQVSHDLGLDGNVTIEPEVPSSEVPRLLRGTDVGVVSYEKNPLTAIATPNKAYEYAALGKAMVVADLNALRRLFGGAVLYYEPGDADSLAAGIGTILEDEALRAELGRRAKAVHEGHGWNIMADRLESLYRNPTGSTAASGGG